MTSESNYQTLTQLGNKSDIAKTPEDAIIEKVKNPKQGTLYAVRFSCPEFTSLCPLTNQPDFAHLIIDYIPDEFLLESKSLKLYLASFRNHGAFHEDCTTSIGLRIVEELNPTWLRIGGYWYPRGGIPIDVFYQTGQPPKEVWIPPQDIPVYKAR